jgi:hypothetical protein
MNSVRYIASDCSMTCELQDGKNVQGTDLTYTYFNLCITSQSDFRGYDRAWFVSDVRTARKSKELSPTRPRAM